MTVVFFFVGFTFVVVDERVMGERLGLGFLVDTLVNIELVLGTVTEISDKFLCSNLQQLTYKF